MFILNSKDYVGRLIKIEGTNNENIIPGIYLIIGIKGDLFILDRGWRTTNFNLFYYKNFNYKFLGELKK